MGEVDNGVRELFSKNPYIKLNDLELGLSEISNEEISVELLKAGIDDELLIKEVDNEKKDSKIANNSLEVNI